MSRFYVGQRVRIKYSDGWPELGGSAGRIVGHFNALGIGGRPCEWLVAPDAWGSYCAPYRCPLGANVFAPRGEQLEPIQPEGMQPAKWEDCMWQPEHVRSAA